MSTSTSDARSPAASWLLAFSDAIAKRDVQALTHSFLPHGWLRDTLVFSWDNRSLEGPKRIAEYLSNSLPNAQIGDIKLDDRPGLAPSFFPASPVLSGIQFAFTFETPSITGRGFTRLLPDSQGGLGWKALSVYVTVDNIKGHEEMDHELGLYDGHTKSWGEVRAERRARVESDPQVVIIGGGQAGLQVAARFKQMGLRTIIIERYNRIGDNWRKRYPMLTLHTPRTHHCLLYAPFPANWPTFTPRDKLAAWLEQYVDSQDLVAWTSSYVLPGPVYDENSRRWTIKVNKNGTEVTLHPAHIILATGTLGEPYTPSISFADAFKGTVMHASEYQGGEPFIGQRVLVVGAGNTSADICQDLAARGAKEVIMLQRSTTCVVSAAFIKKEFNVTWPEGEDIKCSDFKVAAMPLGLLKKLSIAAKDQTKEFDFEMHEKLLKGGLRLDQGLEGSGQKILVFERLGGYWIDVGVADFIGEGKVKVVSGVEIANFTETGVALTGDSNLQVDAVIFATSYYNIRQTIKKTFGDAIIDRTKEVWGLDEEGELKGCYRPSGVPGLWYAAGDFYHSRYMSKQLALLIKAEELGLTVYNCLASVPK